MRAVQRVLTDLLRLDVERGDRLDMIPIGMVPPWKAALLSPEGTRVLMALGGAFGLMVAGALLAYLALVRPGRKTLEALRGSDRLGNIISLLPAERRDALLNELSAGDPGARERVARTLLPFEALADLRPEEFRRLLARVPYQEWAVALRGAPPALSGKVLEQFPEGTRNLIREAMEEPQPKPRVMAVRSRILQQALTLAAEGKLNLGSDAGLEVG